MRLATTLVALLLFCTQVSGLTRVQQLDETWTVTVNGQSVRVNPDSTFRLDNIPSPDMYGPEGPGSRPDFVGDDFVRPSLKLSVPP